MAIFNRYPYTSFQELNLDWILQELKDLTEEWESFEGQYEGITAEAQTVPYGDGASVTVTGGDGQPFNFDFSIPAGKNASVLSTVVKYGTSPDSITQPLTWYDSVPVIPQGDYLWTRITLIFSDGTQSSFYTIARSGIDGMGSVVSVNSISPDGTGNVTIPIPSPSDSVPLMDNIVPSSGVSALYSRADHQHESDVTKQDALISGTNIKTINSTSLLGGGNVDVQATLVSGTNIKTINSESLLGSTDIALQEPLVSGTNIKTINNNSLLGTGDLTISGALTVDELWTNASISSSFTEQTISMDLSDYETLIVYTKGYNGVVEDQFYQTVLIKNKVSHATGLSGDDYKPRIIIREMSFNNAGISIGHGYFNGTSLTSSFTLNDNYAVPVAIYGLK